MSHVTVSRADARTGARPTPQLPVTTVVMPCQDEQLSMGSQNSCAS
jgi:hypothetical protein